MNRNGYAGTLAIAWLALLFACGAAQAQRQVDAPRADGATTPLVVYEPAATPGCAPLALLSHGAGASAERGLPYLGRALSRDGWRVIAMGHRESGREPLRADMREDGVMRGLSALVTDAAAYRARYLDIDAALTWANRSCRAPYKTLIGHSMGAITVMFVAGAQNKLGLPAKGGFDAYVAMSPEGPGRVFPAGAWQGVRAPMLLVTGTHDRGLDGDWHWRTQAFDGLGHGCHALAVFDDAGHMQIGGMDPGDRFDSRIAALTAQFLDSVRVDRCPELASAPGMQVRMQP